MAERQTRNVSLPAHLDAFVDSLVSAGRYRTASEVVRDGLRLLETAEHRRLLEKWVYEGVTEEERERLPLDLVERARERIRDLVDTGIEDAVAGRLTDGPTAMRKLRERLEDRRE